MSVYYWIFLKAPRHDRAIAEDYHKTVFRTSTPFRNNLLPPFPTWIETALANPRPPTTFWRWWLLETNNLTLLAGGNEVNESTEPVHNHYYRVESITAHLLNPAAAVPNGVQPWVRNSLNCSLTILIGCLDTTM